ncbi:MAG: BMP family ABC transporter substrate-binding protein [Lachnospiraceae bacterium]|nr:BMP family ABC transporter substrate-binding protein [Lachnospiraceae bacterium]
MGAEKKNLIWVIVAALLCIIGFYSYHYLQDYFKPEVKEVKVGLVLDGDESTPYSRNFINAVESVLPEYGGRVTLLTRCNVPYDDVEDVLMELAANGCDIIFSNSYDYSKAVKHVAVQYPDIEFCQATGDNANSDTVLSNYHTFMGEIYEGRYIAGMVAGLKLQELIDAGVIGSDEAYIGYVAAYPCPEVISGYTAFILGARQTCPGAVMRVRYTYTWTGYTKEKEMAGLLIKEGCIIISQHSDTIGPAVMCENSISNHPVYHVGYNQDMIDVAPTTSLIGTRINWTPYISDAIKAVMTDRRIEDVVKGHVHGNDIGAGFERNWVEMLELNPAIAPEGGRELVDRTIEGFINGSIHVFSGEYYGYDPENPDDTINLRIEYMENSDASAPSFHYILKDIVIIEN